MKPMGKHKINIYTRDKSYTKRAIIMIQLFNIKFNYVTNLATNMGQKYQKCDSSE